MRYLFWVSFFLNIAMTGITYIAGPERVAIHFGTKGQPDNWTSAGVYVLIMTGLHLLLFATFYFTPYLTRITSPAWISLPNKEYWLSPKNRPLMEIKINALMMQYGAVTLMFMFVLGAMVLQANLSEPVRLRSELFLCFLGGYLAYTVYWCIQFFIQFRIPLGPSEYQENIN